MRESPSSEKPETGAANQPTYDMMMGQLLGDVFRESAYIVDGAKGGEEVKYEGKVVNESMPLPSWADGVVSENKASQLQKALEERLEWHLQELDRRDAEVKKEIEKEEKEQAKKITSDGIKDGYDATTVAKATASPLEDKPKAKKPAKTETIEVLNPGAGVSRIYQWPTTSLTAVI